MEEKREDLDSEKQKKLLLQFVEELSQSQPELYYRPTVEIAHAIKAYIKDGAKITQSDRALVEPLTVSDIQVMLSLH